MQNQFAKLVSAALDYNKAYRALKRYEADPQHGGVSHFVLLAEMTSTKEALIAAAEALPENGGTT